MGGGPAGMQAALVAAERGHRVTLFEKRTRLGGLANIAALPPHKDLYAVLVNRFSERLIASGVKVFLGTAPSVADLAELKPDTLIVATGSVPSSPVSAKASPTPLPPKTSSPAGQGRTACARRGRGMVGSETAEYLALKGGTSPSLN
ncbi:MAG: FAD-dependent oxidoreductase [Bilophila wadsworthia]